MIAHFRRAALVALCACPAWAEVPLPVTIVTAHVDQPIEIASVYGRIEAAESYAAAFRSGGRVTEVLVDVGQHVPRDAVLARLDPTIATAEHAAAQAAIQAAEAALQQALQARDRARRLLERGAGTQAQSDAAIQAYLSAKSVRDQALTRLEKARQTLDDTSLRAIEDAVVTDRSIDPGEIVGAGSTVMTLAREGRREVVFMAPDIAGLSQYLGLKVRLFPVDSNINYDGQVSEISPVVGASGTVQVKVALAPSARADLPIGTLVRAEIARPTDSAIVLPWDVLTSDPRGPAVWVVDPATMRVTLRPVGLAGYGDATVRLSFGVTEGELVVSAGSQGLYEGRVVKKGEE